MNKKIAFTYLGLLDIMPHMTTSMYLVGGLEHIKAYYFIEKYRRYNGT